MQRFTITTLGCKVNQYDAQSVADMLRRCGWSPASKGETADLVLIQTCCVTANAMRKSRQAIRRDIRKHTRDTLPTVCVLGCYGTYNEEKIHNLLAEAGIDSRQAFVAPSDADPAAVVRHIVRTLDGPPPLLHKETPPPAKGQAERAKNPKNIRQRRKQSVGHYPGTRDLDAIDRFAGHQRAFVKIQDGCDAFCSYCIVSYTRPHVYSRPAEDILDECRRLIDAGHRELVLCGVFLGAFGRDTAIRRRWTDAARSPLAELLQKIAELDGLWRVRLSSLEPGDLTDDLLDVLQHPAVAPHLHLPLQSGSAAILRRMNRQYTAEQFRRTADRLRAALDRPALTTDIIVGFPGETEEDFQATLDVARHAGFAKIHAFPFSAIKPTLAWTRRKEAPPIEVTRQRMDRLADLETALATDYRRQFIGETLQGIVERNDENGDWLRGSATVPVPVFSAKVMTDRYLTAAFSTNADLTGRVVDLRITAATPEGLAAERLMR